MRRLESDVSPRMRPRGPEIFRVGWVRVLVGSVAGVVVGLVVGPFATGWLGVERLLVSWIEPDVRGLMTTAPRGMSLPESALATARVPSGVAPVASVEAPRPAVVAVRRPVPVRTVAPGLTAPPPVYRIQVGAFLDHTNADRLVDRLRRAGLGAMTSVFEQSRVFYRVLVEPPGDSAAPGAAETASLEERLRGLGFVAEHTDEGTAVTDLVPLRVATDVSRRLRERGIRVRLKQEVGSATYRVVRVGSYATGEEAERELAGLVARGFEGFVVREQ